MDLYLDPCEKPRVSNPPFYVLSGSERLFKSLLLSQKKPRFFVIEFLLTITFLYDRMWLSVYDETRFGSVQFSVQVTKQTGGNIYGKNG